MYPVVCVSAMFASRFLSLLLLRATLALIVVQSALQAEPAFALTPRSEHPRLFYTSDRVAQAKQRLGIEKPLADAWAALLASANQAVEKPSASAQNLETLALAYRMTGDKRYAERARDALLREIQRPNWGEAELLRRDPPWHAGLGLARTLFSVSVVFDAIHDALTPDERRTIAKGIVDLGILPTLDDWVLGEKRIHAIDTMGHNWWSACVFTAGIGCLAVLDEEPRAAGWLEQISHGSIEWFSYAGSLIENKPANFDRDGAFYESVNYASFALSEYLLFRLGWTNALRSPAPAEIPQLERLGEFFLNVSYPNAAATMTLNFGDGSLHADGTRPIALLWALGARTPDYAWYLSNNRQLNYREGLDRSTPFGLLYFPTEAELSAAPKLPSLPPSHLYRDIGWATLRSSWEKNATLLALRSGYTWNHSHADAGSFILFHAGQNLLIDSGNCSYGRPEYDSYYRQSAAHNVVLFNGQAENPEDTYTGSKFPGSISHLIDTGDLKYLMADATGPTSRAFNRNYRHVLWIGDVILVIDDVEAFQPGQFEWLLHVDGKAERRGLDLHVANGEASVIVRPLFPEPFPNAGLPTDYPECMRLVEKTGLQDHEPDKKVTYYAFTPAEQTRRTKFITAITLVNPTNKDRLPQLERIQSEDMIGVRVRQNGASTNVYLNLRADGRIRHRNANNVIEGWETDAYLAVFTYPESSDTTEVELASRVFLADASYLRRDGKAVFDSLSKAFVTWTNRDGVLDVTLQGQPRVRARLHTPEKPKETRLNGERGASSYDAASQTTTLSLQP